MTTVDLSLCTLCNEPIHKSESKCTGSASSLRYCSNSCRQRAYRIRMKASGLGHSTSNGLLNRLSSFVGRTCEVVELDRLMRTARLLTLTGPPGVGKTRLAVELAEKAQRGGRCETVVVDLGSLTGNDRVRQRVTTALGLVNETDARTAETRAPDNRHRLLLLDTCEHLLDECGLIISDLLPRHPNLRIVATSRESLRLPGEIVFPVAGLTLPDLDGDPLVTRHLRSAAVRLFIDRARAVVSDYQLTEENASCIGAICARLDGLPLGIELAAQLVRAVPLAEIHDRLVDRLSLLTSGWRSADQRHQSWRGALAWSYELLTPPEQSLFRRLSVLPGGFGSDAVVALAADGHVSISMALAMLAKLEAKSLIMPSTDRKEGATRFRMLESIRCFGQERLLAEGESAWTFDRLTEWLAEIAGPLLDTAVVPLQTVERLGDEHDNLGHVLEWLSTGNDERQLLLARALIMVETHGAPQEATRRTVLHTLDGADPHSKYRTIALEGAAVLAGRSGDHDEALRLAQQALDLEPQSRPLFSRLLLLLSTVKEMHGDQNGALADLEQCLAISRRSPDGLLAAVCMNNIAGHLLSRGDLPQAALLIDECRSLLPINASPDLLCTVLHTAGALALERDDLREAKRYFTEILQCVTGPSGAAHGIEGLAIAAVRSSLFDHGLRLIAAAETMSASAVRARPWWRERIGAASAAAMQAIPTTRADAALAYGRTLDRRQAVACALGLPGTHLTKVDETEPLSRREWDITALVADGLTNRQIATRLYLSVRTVETHIRKIRDTLGLRSRSHVAAWAAQQAPSTATLVQPIRERTSAKGRPNSAARRQEISSSRWNGLPQPRAAG
jgi:predicted ATPase/DNA-binding CsgD family transcriptional regulator